MAEKKMATSKAILAWDDDPGASAQLSPTRRKAPKLAAARLSIAIKGAEVPADVYKIGTAEFRFWSAADSLGRGVKMWKAILPSRTQWAVGETLPVHLDQGRELNAFYTRGGYGDEVGLSFFGDEVLGQPVFSGESPDIVTHELGHAVLDALRPELWDMMSVEAAAFHESFGDISSVLAALQLKSMREMALAETGGKIFRSSRISRLAEQLGWALRQSNPSAAEPDCLRNAVNSFFYRDPSTLPPAAPAALLSTEPHSFSRVFTGAFVEMLGGIFSAKGKNGSEQQLLDAANDASKILVNAVAEAPIVPAYFSQIAAHCVEADAELFEKAYRDVIKGAFVRRGILSLEGATKTELSARRRSMRPEHAVDATSDRRAVDVRPMERARYGLASPLFVAMPGGSRRYDVTPSRSDFGALEAVTGEQAAESFLEDLFRRGRINMDEASGDADELLPQPFIRKTHRIEADKERMTLRRRMFDCGFD